MSRGKIVAYFLTLNEEEYLPVALESIISHVDKVIIMDGGSEDRTREIAYSICGDKLTWIQSQQPGERYGEGWEQARRRNAILGLIDSWDGHWWILEMGADEVYGDELWDFVKYLDDANPLIYVFPTYNFFGDMEHYIKGKDSHVRNGFLYHDPHARLWRSNMGVRHNEQEHHSFPLYKGKNACDDETYAVWLKIFLFHLHRGWGSRVKHCEEELLNSEIKRPKLLTFKDQYPPVLEKYLNLKN